ncbi:hypothetical protein JCM10207_005263 [Rhodosporidiobolus poonsookiae]
MSSPPMVLPAPPPAPDMSPFHRLPSSASTLRSPSAAPPAPPPPTMPAFEEPTIDDLTREIHSLQELVSTVASQCGTISSLRDSVITSGPSAPADVLTQLASLTTSTGSLVLSLSSDLSSTTARLALLRSLADTGNAAALPNEVSQLEEHLAVVSLEAGEGMKKIRRLAWEEVDARESTKRRLEERVRRENVGMGEEGVEMAVRQAMGGAEARVGELDVMSYAGRVAAENPFTELLSRTDTRFSTATTLVGSLFGGGSSSTYGKVDGAEDEESQPLAASAGDAERGLAGGAGMKKAAFLTRVKMNWKDWMVRILVVVSVVGFIVGIITYEAIAQKKDAEESEASASASAAATASATSG